MSKTIRRRSNEVVGEIARLAGLVRPNGSWPRSCKRRRAEMENRSQREIPIRTLLSRSHFSLDTASGHSLTLREQSLELPAKSLSCPFQDSSTRFQRRRRYN